jgi:hypothetical protein
MISDNPTGIPSDRTSLMKGDILVVDDVPENLQLLSTMLAQQGYEVCRVINGRLALSVTHSAPRTKEFCNCYLTCLGIASIPGYIPKHKGTNGGSSMSGIRRKRWT